MLEACIIIARGRRRETACAVAGAAGPDPDLGAAGGSGAASGSGKAELRFPDNTTHLAAFRAGEGGAPPIRGKMARFQINKTDRNLRKVDATTWPPRVLH